MRKIQDHNRQLNEDSLQLKNDLVDKETEASVLRVSVATIPTIEKKRDELQDKITRLEYSLQEVRFENTRLLDELKGANLSKIQEIAAKISQMLIQKNPKSFSEEETILFKSLMGNQIIDTMKD